MSRNFILITRYYPDLGSSSNWSVLRREFASTNRKHYPDLGIDTSSVWNVSSRFSDFTSRGNQCCVAKCRLFSQANFHRDAVHVRENSVWEATSASQGHECATWKWDPLSFPSHCAFFASPFTAPLHCTKREYLGSWNRLEGRALPFIPTVGTILMT